MKLQTTSLSSLVIFAIALSCMPTQTQAITLRDAREFCKNHRYLLLAATSAAIIYMYARKPIAQYRKEHKSENNGENRMDIYETAADVLIKSTKLIGTLFKIVRAVTCPLAGKVAGDQWLDDFSQLA